MPPAIHLQDVTLPAWERIKPILLWYYNLSNNLKGKTFGSFKSKPN